MVERSQIVALAARDIDAVGVLVTLVRAEGSSYRKAGARLLTVRGEYAGTISGGCLEAEVVRKAPWTVRAGANVERYATTFEDTSDIPYGLGCGGAVDLLLEPSGTPEFMALLGALTRSLQGEPAAVVTFLPSRTAPMLRAVISATGGIVFRSRGLDSALIDLALTGGVEDVFLERLAAPQRLIILGAGNDVQPLVRMAVLLGWNVVVVDGRKHLARPERFPEANGVLAIDAGLIHEVAVDGTDAVVLMTHSYAQDRDWLAAVLPIAPRYLGVLGARRRSSLLVSEASAITGLSISECCARIYAPVGLDLGGDGPEAIALAVMAEAQACCMGRLADSRRLSATDVLTQTAAAETLQSLQTSCALSRRGLR